MSKKPLYLLALGLFAGVLASCAPISEKSCRAGNWYGIGFQDGKRGAPLSRINVYAKECAEEYGIRTDRAAWAAGREEGLKQYCTTRNAYHLGKNGRRVNAVCPNGNVLAKANEAGLRYHEVDSQIDDLNDERDELRQILRELRNSPEPSKSQIRLRHQTIRLLDHVEERIFELELRLVRIDRSSEYS